MARTHAHAQTHKRTHRCTRAHTNCRWATHVQLDAVDWCDHGQGQGHAHAHAHGLEHDHEPGGEYGGGEGGEHRHGLYAGAGQHPPAQAQCQVSQVERMGHYQQVGFAQLLLERGRGRSPSRPVYAVRAPRYRQRRRAACHGCGVLWRFLRRLLHCRAATAAALPRLLQCRTGLGRAAVDGPPTDAWLPTRCRLCSLLCRLPYVPPPACLRMPGFVLPVARVPRALSTPARALSAGGRQDRCQPGGRTPAVPLLPRSEPVLADQRRLGRFRVR